MSALLNKNDIEYLRVNIDNFKTNKEIAEIFSLSVKQIRDILYYNKIRRTYTNQGRVKYNVDFFCKINEISCYWAGFIAADGNIGVRPNGRDKFMTINLQKNDEEHLINVITHVEGENLKLIERSVNNKYKYVSVILYNNNIVKSLRNNFLIEERKTLNCKFPEISHKFITDYIRGFIDGDGCIRLSTEKKCLKIELSFVGNKNFIIKIADIINIPFYIRKIKGSLYRIQYSKYNSIDAILKIYFPKNKFCLYRKRDKLAEYLNRITENQKNRLLKAKGWEDFSDLLD